MAIVKYNPDTGALLNPGQTVVSKDTGLSYTQGSESPSSSKSTTPEGNQVSSMGPIVAPQAQYLDPNTGKELPIGSPNPTAQSYTGLNAPAPIVPEKILPRAGMMINSAGVEVPQISRAIYTPGTVQNASSSTPVGSGPGGAQTDAEKAASTYLDTTLVAPKTEEEIIKDRTAQSKDKIESLTNYYNSKRAELQPSLDITTREANARAVLSGLSGSQEGTNLAVEAAGKNAVKINAVEAERANALATVYGGIQTFAHDEAIRQQKLATDSATGILTRGQDVIKEKEAAYKTAAEHLAVIAANPEFDLEKIKVSDPATYNSLAQSVGGEDALKGLVFASRPKTSIVGTPERIGDYMQQNIKQADGTIKSEYIKLPADVLATDTKNFKSMNTDNGTFISKDGGSTWTQLANSMKPATTPKNTVTISKDLIRIGDQKLSDTRGADGYVDPNVYQTAFNDWVNGTDTHEPIGTAKEFLASFPPKNYVNPENTFLPDYLMPTGAKKTSTTAKARF